jgi:Holliday junction resolvase RusA-like endonuclease
MIEFFVPGKPVPMARPRVTRTGHAYTPKACAEYKAIVAAAAREAMKGREMLTDAVQVRVGFYFPVPKSWRAGKAFAARNGMFPHTARPDLDNLYKAVTDALNGIVYKDDSQIIFCTIGKRYRDKAGVSVRVESWEGE